MAKQPESFMDLFANFGRELKMPNVDIERIMSHHRKNLEALEKAARASASGATSVMSKQREALQDTLREITDMAQGIRAPGSPQEMITKQADFARKSFEGAVKHAGEVAEIIRKSGSESVDILRQRIREAMEEVREGYSDKK